MGYVIEELEDHEGYGLWRLADGTVTGASGYRLGECTAYVAGCECGWQASGEHPPTEEGQQAAYEQWLREHAMPELARQAERRREDLGRVLAWLGGQARRLEDPAVVDRVGRGLDRARELVKDTQRDLGRQTSEREAGGER